MVSGYIVSALGVHRLFDTGPEGAFHLAVLVGPGGAFHLATGGKAHFAAGAAFEPAAESTTTARGLAIQPERFCTTGAATGA